MIPDQSRSRSACGAKAGPGVATRGSTDPVSRRRGLNRRTQAGLTENVAATAVAPIPPPPPARIRPRRSIESAFLADLPGPPRISNCRVNRYTIEKFALAGTPMASPAGRRPARYPAAGRRHTNAPAPAVVAAIWIRHRAATDDSLP